MPDISDPDFNKFSPLIQGLAALGAVAGGALLWLRGFRKNDNTAEVQSKLDRALLRIDLEDVMRVNRESMENKFNDFSKDIRQELAEFEERIRDVEQNTPRPRRQ